MPTPRPQPPAPPPCCPKCGARRLFCEEDYLLGVGRTWVWFCLPCGWRREPFEPLPIPENPRNRPRLRKRLLRSRRQLPDDRT